jgi:hypothetical protein
MEHSMNQDRNRAAWKYMSRIQEFSDHNNGEFFMTGLADEASLSGMLLQPESNCVFDVKF